MNAEDISKCLQRTGNLHLVTMNRKGKVLEGLREIQRIIGNGQLNKLLTMQNEDGMTMLHPLMFYSEDPKEATAVLEFVEGVMDGELFMQFLIQQDNKGVFPIIYANFHVMKDILVFMGRYFSNQDVRDMLLENKVRLGKSIRETDCALEEILYLEEYSGSELFQEILISKDEEGCTRLHRMMFRGRVDKLFVRDLKVYERFLDSDSFRAFLFSQNTFGDTFLHEWASLYRGSQYIYIFRELHSILSLDEFDHLLNIRNEIGQTLIHKYDSVISELSFLDELMGKEKLIKFVTAKGDYGRTRLYYVMYDYFKDNNELLFQDLKYYSELLDESSFRNFLLTKQEDGNTFCYYFYKYSREIERRKLERIISPDLFLELRETVQLESKEDLLLGLRETVKLESKEDLFLELRKTVKLESKEDLLLGLRKTVKSELESEEEKTVKCCFCKCKNVCKMYCNIM